MQKRVNKNEHLANTACMRKYQAFQKLTFILVNLISSIRNSILSVLLPLAPFNRAFRTSIHDSHVAVSRDGCSRDLITRNAKLWNMERN